MHDQVGALHEAGVSAAFLNSTLDWEQTQDVERKLLAGQITLLYAAPERVSTPRFLGLLDTLHAHGQLGLFAIDEAHCVSQWGHDFRPEYRALTVLHERWPEVPRIALTATADDVTRADIIERLQLQEAEKFVSSFDRPNIRYTIVEKKDAKAQLLRFIQRQHPDESGIVYCQSRRRVEELAQALCEAGLDALPAALRRRCETHGQFMLVGGQYVDGVVGAASRGDQAGEEHDARGGSKLSSQLRAYYTQHLDPFDQPEPKDLEANRGLLRVDAACWASLRSAQPTQVGSPRRLSMPR